MERYNLLIIYMITYLILRLWAFMNSKNFYGNIYDIDKGSILLTIFVILLIFSIVHYGLYKFVFNKDIENAHNSKYDVINLYDAIKASAAQHGMPVQTNS